MRCTTLTLASEIISGPEKRGMTANLCCESTGRHAMEKGYDVTFVSDAIGAAGVMEYEAAININFPLISNAVIKTEDFLAAIEGGNAATLQIEIQYVALMGVN